MKKLLLLLVLCHSCWGGLMTTSLDGSTATVATNTTATYGTSTVFPVGNSTTLGLGVGFANTGTNALAVPFVFEKSLDFKNWQSLLTWNITANGTTAVYSTTNLTSLGGDVGWVKLSYVTNLNTTVLITNLYVVGFSKPPR